MICRLISTSAKQAKINNTTLAINALLIGAEIVKKYGVVVITLAMMLNQIAQT